MRKITIFQIIVFETLLIVILALGIGTSYFSLGHLPLGDFRGLILFFSAILFIYLYAFIIHRLFLAIMPLKTGEVPEKSKQEFIYHIYILFYILLFFPLMRSGFLPLPVMRMIYLCLGAKLGSNTYCAGIIHDPIFVSIGSNSVVGQYALIIPHVIEKRFLAHYNVKIGDNVTIGAHAVVMSDVEIGNDVIIATGAIVPKGSRISDGEVWGGVPAKRIK